MGFNTLLTLPFDIIKESDIEKTPNQVIWVNVIVSIKKEPPVYFFKF
jgi:hypothetical protein